MVKAILPRVHGEANADVGIEDVRLFLMELPEFLKISYNAGWPVIHSQKYSSKSSSYGGIRLFKANFH